MIQRILRPCGSLRNGWILLAAVYVCGSTQVPEVPARFTEKFCVVNGHTDAAA